MQHIFLYNSYLQTINEYNFMCYNVSEVVTSTINELSFFMKTKPNDKEMLNQKGIWFSKNTKIYHEELEYKM